MYDLFLDQPKTFKIGPFTTSETEIKDLIKGWLAISIAFAIVLAGGLRGLFTINIGYLVLIAATTVGAGFLLHELAHKYVAQKYHCWAEFRADNKMLILAIVMSLFGFVFAAPGGVIISGTVTSNKYGKIAAAGPIMSMILAVIFLLTTFIFPIKWLAYGYMINAWLAVFNMIPVGNLDGKKVLHWNKGVYAIMLICAIGLFISQYIF